MQQNQSKAVCLMLLATASFSIMNLLVRYLPDMHVFQMVFFRSLVSTIVCSVWLKLKNIPLKGNRQGLLILRGILGLGSIVCFFYTLKMMPMGASVALKYTAPLITLIFSGLILQEKVSKTQFMALALALGGALLLKGFDARIEWSSFFLALLGASCSGFVYLVLRKISQVNEALQVVNYFMFVAFVFSSIAVLPYWKSIETGREWAIVLSLSVTSCIAQIAMTQAFQLAKAAQVVVFKYLEILYGLLFAWFLFGETYGTLSILGMVLIVLGILINLIQKRQKSYHNLLNS